MLAIRMQRTGRSGHAQFRVIVQDARAHPKSGRVVEYLGSYNPHTKVASINAEKIDKYLKNGAQPSERVVKLLKKEGVKVPKWAVTESKKDKSVKNPEKLRRNRPAGEPAPKETEVEGAEAETPVEGSAEGVPSEPENPEPAEEAPAPDSEAPGKAMPEASEETAPTESPAEPEAPKES